MNHKCLKTCPPLYNILGDKLTHELYGIYHSFNEKIDYISPYIMSNPIMYGHDFNNRMFICIRIHGVLGKKYKQIHGISEFWTVGTFYQMYGGKKWGYASYNPGTILYHDNIVRETDYDILEQRLNLLCSGGTIYDIDFKFHVNTRPINLIEGNGMYKLYLC